MTRAIVLREYGGPEKLLWEEVSVGEPGPGELLVRHTAIGVNFHDTYVRSGSYKTLTLPGIPGVEAAGVVEKIGPDVTAFIPGDRIVYVTQTYGAYSERRVLPAAVAFRLPDAISDEAASEPRGKGPDGLHVAAAYTPGAAGRDHTHPCSRRRCWTVTRSLGQTPGCAGYCNCREP